MTPVQKHLLDKSCIFQKYFSIFFLIVFLYLCQIYLSRNLIMYGSFEILSFYKVISVNMNVRGFCIFMLTQNWNIENDTKLEHWNTKFSI